MCLICDGWTPDEVLAGQVENIDTHGFTLVSVTDPVPWTYSIGLRWRLQIPELIVVGWPAEAAAGVIHCVVEAAEQQRVGLHCGSVVAIGEGSVRFGPVAPDNLAGDWFAQWHRIARASGHGHRPLRALQAQPNCASQCGEPHDLLDHALARRITPDGLALARRRRLDGEGPRPVRGGGGT